MLYLKNYLIVLFLVTTLPGRAQENIKLKSPGGNIVFSFRLTQKAPLYRVIYKGETLIEDSELGLFFKEAGTFKSGLNMLDPQFNEADKTYNLVVGKAKKVRDYHGQVIIPLVEIDGMRRQVNLVVRAFNDGLAFRYEFPKQKSWSSYTLLDEKTTFNIADNPTVKTLFWDDYTNSHEGFYHTLAYSQVPADTLMDMPALFEFPGEIYMAITEANLRDYAGMYLKKDNGILRSQLSPLPGQTAIKVKATLPHQTPWRVMMISDELGALLASNIITNLNEPAKIKDTSWITPGKTTFHWWNGDIIPDTTFAPGVNFATNKYYIDFASRNDIEYHSVIGYGGFAWYKSDASSYSVAGPHTDVTKPVSSLDMQRVCDYAKEKGVGILVWVNWEAIYPDLEKAFSQFQEWGIKGMMVDFLNRDDQQMVRIQEKILQKAAEHELLIYFHGAYKSTGLSRTYPNEFGREGALNYENNKWRSQGLSPDHDLNIVFTRLLAGPTSYHLGGFRAVPADEFKTQYTRPLMIGTRCHMLAMYVVMENFLPMVADYPKAYEGQPGFSFLRQMPTTWDETIVPDAQVDKYVTVARRKGQNWYIGSLNNSTSRPAKISLDFLGDGTYTAEMYSDASDTEQHPNHLTKQVKTVTSTDVITIDMAAGGGGVIKVLK